MPSQNNITNIPSSRVDFIDKRTGLMSREWYRFFLNLFNLTGAGNNPTSLDDLQVGPPTGSGEGGGSGTVTSVQVSGGTTGLTTSGGPITSAGTITFAGTLNVANGGTGATTAAGAPFALKGANSDITSISGITGAISSPDYVQFDTAYATTLGVGQLGWDGNNTLGLGMYGGNVVQKIGEDFFYYVKASAAITKGQLCMFTGAVGASGVATAAPSTGVTSGQYIMGVAAESIAHNGFGLIQVFGTLRNVDTSAFADGDVLYYDSAVTGGFTTTFPSSGPIVTCAAVVNGGSAGGGVLQVRVSVTQRINAGSGVSVTQTSSGATIANTSPSSGGTVTSVGTAGTVNGLTLTGGPITTSGTITLGGTLDLSSPPAIGGTIPAAATFTTLTATGQTSLGGAAGSESLRVNTRASAVNWLQVSGSVTGNADGPYIYANGTDSSVPLSLLSRGSSAIRLKTNDGNQLQLNVSHTASAVNYVQVTGAATNNPPNISVQGSDTNIGVRLDTKGNGQFIVRSNGGSNVQFRVYGTNAAVNNLAVAGTTSGNAPILSAEGSDTNISQVFQSKGTGAIDLAAGSKGVNISNGGTVTALTVTANGTAYTTIPTVAVTAPTTAGGVTSTATAVMQGLTRTVVSGGSGYTLNDVVTTVGGTFTTAATFTVSGVSGGVVTALTANNRGAYSVLPTGTLTTTGGTGTGLTLTIDTWSVVSLSITNAGSGYVEQPTVSFSGGGGSGAAAYATVGSNTTLKTISSVLSLQTDVGEVLRVTNNSGTSTTPSYLNILGGSGQIGIYNGGASTNISTNYNTKGTGSHLFSTNGTAVNQQFAITNTASAVNYVQVTGAATSGQCLISMQGSDSNVGAIYTTKGTSSHQFRTNGASQNQMFITHTANAVNRITVTGAVAGSGPVYGVEGSDTNIDLNLTPKGTGQTKAGGAALNATNGIIINAQTVNTNCTVAATDNAMSVGPITVASGVSVTVSSGSRWVVI